MRPIKLQVCAFGPYAAQQAFDFAELKGESFFLIHGPTGSGKTSILDAICFALYGEASGIGRQKSRMRSDHADPATATQVTLDFALGEQKYRVTRRPEQQRPRKRGAGFATEPQSATLWRSNGQPEEQVLADGWSEVTEQVERLMGFQVDQFRQVVVLPQGMFERLLMSKSDQREEVLEALFQVERFGLIEEALKEREKELRTKSEQMRAEQEAVLKAAAAASAPELLQRRETSSAELVTTRANAVALKDARKAAADKLAAAHDVARKLNERRLADAQVKQLDALREEIALKDTELARATKAQALEADEAAAKLRRTEEQAATLKLERARQSLTAAQLAAVEAQRAAEKETAREGERTSARDRVESLKQIEGRVAELERARAAAKQADASHAARAKEKAAAEALLATARKGIEAVEKSKLDLTALSAQLAARRQRAESLATALANRVKLDSHEQALREGEKQLAKLGAKARELAEQSAWAKSNHAKLAALWAAGQAAILARSLTDAQPCPVCGSLEHPSPATSAHELPSEHDINQAKLQADKIEVSAREAADALAAREKQQAAALASAQVLREGLASHADHDAAALQGLLAAARQEMTQSEAAGAELAKCDAHLTALREQERASQTKLNDAEASTVQARGLADAARAVLAERESGVPEALRPAQALAQEQATATALVKQLAEALQAATRKQADANLALAQAQASVQTLDEAAKTATQIAEATRKDFSEKAQAAGFADHKAFVVARRTQPQMDQLDAQTRQYRIDCGAARQRAQRAADDAANLLPPDLAALELAAQEAEKQMDHGMRLEAALAQKVSACDDAIKQLEKLDTLLATLQERFTLIAALSQAANGNNPWRMSFKRYVLGVFLDQVLEAATARLRLMSHSRYQLQRVRETQVGRAAGGLDLEVLDHYTSVVRPVSTLSGGETFQASLSLALGLADVVQSIAGGVKLETIFVDEGFGSLDQESLELAINALWDLQQGGRLVGIISHVGDLQDRIRARLEVVPGRTGSVAKFVVG